MSTEHERIAIDAAERFYELVAVRLYPPGEGYEPHDRTARTGAVAVIAAMILIDQWKTDRDEQLLGTLQSIRDYGIDQESPRR